VYKRLQNGQEKQEYRALLIKTLQTSWAKKYGSENAEKLIAQFLAIDKRLDAHGAVIFGEMISSKSFEKLINRYTEVLEKSGSKSWIHSYVNLANHPDFLVNSEFNGAFLHPLLIALISYRIGGPVRVVDARGKDAEPIEVLAQDNMLHIDNTPFNDEYKVILTWERGKPSGPKGQNFVFLPGTHKGVRQCQQGEHGPWSSENASIFITPQSVDHVLDFQESILGKRAVVELTHNTKPLTTLFAAGALVHHRHRTASGFARSCMILAFHRAQDHLVQLIDPTHLQRTAVKTDRFYQSLFGRNIEAGRSVESHFLEGLAEKSDEIVLMMEQLAHAETTIEIVPEARELSDLEIQQWKTDCTIAPTVEDKKTEASVVSLTKMFSLEEFVEHVGKMMAYDKHGPLDLILYPDAHEEMRKWARNQIREKNVTVLNDQLRSTWIESMRSPIAGDLLSPTELQTIAYDLAAKAEEKIALVGSTASLGKEETISPIDAYRSVRQLLLDLGETIVRCADKTAFLSTSLFIFWGADTLMRFEKAHDHNIKNLGADLLQNYIATAALVEKYKSAELA
jgi:hypothetical protein